MATSKTQSCPEDCIRLPEDQWASELNLEELSGRIVGIRKAAEFVLNQAAEEFKGSHDQEARRFRNLAVDLNVLADEAKGALADARQRHGVMFSDG